jgi:hypothetical protein
VLRSLVRWGGRGEYVDAAVVSASSPWTVTFKEKKKKKKVAKIETFEGSSLCIVSVHDTLQTTTS